ncbi:MAG: NifU family protein [Candidatus Microthrix sp.]|nr:NifU family protein [Candidatus Microthrix sp.]
MRAWEEPKAYILMGGGCQGCAVSAMTLRSGIERTLKDQIPEILEVVDVTDHASGTNPYYEPAKK